MSAATGLTICLIAFFLGWYLNDISRIKRNLARLVRRRRELRELFLELSQRGRRPVDDLNNAQRDQHRRSQFSIQADFIKR